MRHIIPAALALTMAVGGVAMAQTGATSTAPAPGTTATTNSTTAPGGLGSTTNGTPGASNAAVSTSSAANPHAPVPGANSFTEGEARSRIQDKGFGQVTNLKLDGQGVWRGTASKDGKSTNVALDYQGNVVAQ